MENTTIESRMSEMGLTHDGEFLLMLLPLVYVAWADDELDEKESQYIEGVANSYGISGEADAILSGWLAATPSYDYIERGVELLRDLAKRGQGAVTVEHLQQLVIYARKVAESSGGLFNALFTVGANERRLLKEIAVVFDIESIDWEQAGQSWAEIEFELE